MQRNKNKAQDIVQGRLITWFSRLLRWALGITFITTGIIFYHRQAWPAIVFGLLIFITGFFKPRRCLEENCNIKNNPLK